LYHVANGEVLSQNLSDGQKITTLEGGKLTVDTTGEGTNPRICDSQIVTTFVDGQEEFSRDGNCVAIVTADVIATNGVIHIINEVLIPASINLETLSRTCRLSQLQLSAFNGYGKVGGTRSSGKQQSYYGGGGKQSSYYGGKKNSKVKKGKGKSKGSYGKNHGKFNNNNGNSYYSNNGGPQGQGQVQVPQQEVIVVKEEDGYGVGNYVRVGSVDGVPIVLVKNQGQEEIIIIDVDDSIVADDQTFNDDGGNNDDLDGGFPVRPTEPPLPTNRPTPRPTPSPTPRPTNTPTPRPTPRPTNTPTRAPTQRPTRQPTPRPTRSPTFSPTPLPTPFPTSDPTRPPTRDPTSPPTLPAAVSF